jgi:4'-phosphopantetheinyl transferase
MDTPSPERHAQCITVHCFSLDHGGPDDLALLAPDERARADRFHFADDRRRYIAGRAEVRRRLADRSGTSPEGAELEFGPQGRPALLGREDADFNFSHSRGWAILAVTGGITVGIDIEAVQPGIAASGIAEHFFSSAEVGHLASLPDAVKDRAFTECWTRKEAYLKGKGGGLSLPLDGFDVSFGPDRPPKLLRSAIEPSDVDRWTLVDLTEHVPGRFVAAIAVLGSVGRFTLDIDGEQQRGTT